MKLHLGCGKRRIPGWINVDIDPSCEPDVVADVFRLIRSCEQMPAINSVDIIYACHVLEHAGRHEYKAVLRRWWEVLKPGGTLRLSVPNLGAVFDSWYERGTSMDKLLGFLYGGQKSEQDYHKMGWDLESLTHDLHEAGFKMVQRYDRDKTEYANVDDLSACYLPHISKCGDMVEYRRGVLLSLNVECTK